MTSVVAAPAEAVRALAVLAASGLPVPLVREVGQVRVAVRRADDHAPAVAAVAAVGAAAGRVFLVAKAEATVAAVTPAHEERHPVDEHGSRMRNAELGVSPQSMTGGCFRSS